MPERTEKEIYQIIWLIRRLFRAFAQKSAENLETFGISVADRAVMEFLYPEKKLSVPEIAKQYHVSRQHVQATVNSLLNQELVLSLENPRHKRSPHIMLNENGRMLFESVLRKDEETIKVLFSHLEKNDVHITLKTLQSLLAKLN
ncbi:MAG: winged helix-turn-helix transcriptional regulator [Burkholderiales bacterium]|nr:winged helix-turn-helix transcriptional regulator [Nitrosomonas sp.]MCP5275096.1 winged helix-turn-helix transcriptional regulator [Burkholderiales bacterium]